MTQPARALQTDLPGPEPAPAKIVKSCQDSLPQTPVITESAKRVHPEFEGQGNTPALNDGLSWQTTPGLLDDEYHEQLSDRLGIHRATPAWSVPCTEADMRLWLKEIGITQEHYLRVTALRSLADFIELNPRWSLRAWIGTVLEMKAEEMGAL